MSTFAVGEEAEQTGAGRDPRGRQGGGADRHAPARRSQPGSDRARRRRGAHAQDRPLLPRRHGGRLRRLAGAAGARTPTATSIFWSGSVDDDGKGPVEPGAHFYRSYQLDGEGNPINKRNAWQARSVLYVRLIPPGAADVGALPRARSRRTPRVRSRFTAKLNYRKFSHYYTQFAYAGQPKPGQDPSLVATQHRQPRILASIQRTSRPTSPARSRTEIPDLPIVTLARSQRRSCRWARPNWTAGRAQEGSRALERLGHRPAAAGRSEGRRVRLHEGHRGRARIRRRLAERRARADSGRRDRRRQAVSSRRRWRSTPSSAASTSSRR